MIISPTCTGLHNGALIDLENPDWRAIDIHSVAISLSRIPRFLGHTIRPVSVLEHSIAVARIVPPRLRLAALLHDAHEALIGDITRPMRRVLAKECGAGVGVGIDNLAYRVDVVVVAKVLTFWPEFSGTGAEGWWHLGAAIDLAHEMRGDHVCAADDAMCAAEMRLYARWNGEPRGDSLAEPPAPDVLIEEWLQALEDLVHLRFGATRESVDPAKWWLQP